jgi:hypothetical protein
MQRRELVVIIRGRDRMKKCPHCAEEIQEEAIKCKHCQSDLIVANLGPKKRFVCLILDENRKETKRCFDASAGSQIRDYCATRGWTLKSAEETNIQNVFPIDVSGGEKPQTVIVKTGGPSGCGLFLLIVLAICVAFGLMAAGC